MTEAIVDREALRMVLQRELDAKKDQAERNRLGQFSTPTELSLAILRYANERFGKSRAVRFIDPAIGTGSFYSALLAVFQRSRIAAAVGYEIDPHYGAPAAKLWNASGLEIHLNDFTMVDPPQGTEQFDLLICNPPYVRHHHISNPEKQRLKARAWNAGGMEINGLAGLYCYFMVLSHPWMADGGLAGWLVPSEFMDVNYGSALKRYLLNRVTLHHIHRFDPHDVQFGDALVSSAVVWFRNRVSPPDHVVRFTFGGSLDRPRVDRLVPVATLRRSAKWTRFPTEEHEASVAGPVLGDFFEIRRGIVTGSNRFFILPVDEIEERGLPAELFRPILPSPRYLAEDEVPADDRGNPVLDRRLFLLDCRWGAMEIMDRYPRLWSYLETGRARGITDGHICRHRKPWYVQENRAPTPFVCTYIGRSDTKRGRPFRFILNHSRATAANVYLMLYPKGPIADLLEDDPAVKRDVWRLLNAISPQALLGEGRVYGGGLHKLEPKELANVPVPAIEELLPGTMRPREPKQGELFRVTADEHESRRSSHRRTVTSG